ncbi:MAG: adenosylcobinamide-phosphate synthase CbiB [Hyphomicrobiales bacterium]|nr:adenosylcobinamide-phosphate synthase CbiB [Hyphomicrobiales bacterium]
MFLADQTVAVILLAALAADGVLGDPPQLWDRLPHPVVLMGRLIGVLDHRLNRSAERINGVMAIAILVLVAGGVGVAIHLLARSHPIGVLLETLMAAILLAQRSLYDHVNAVAVAFREGGIEAARHAVSRIVGRDPERLDEAGICRAAIETTAENYSDGVVAPAFWYLVGGLPGMMIYKAVNTADSMIGHRTPRHERFGWAAARLDDLMNYAPARISAGLIWLAALLPEYDHRSAARAVREDGPLHRSPNAGWPEAAMAGALGLALAGPRHYAAGKVIDAWMNRDGDREAGCGDIRGALRFYVRSCGMLVGAVALIAALQMLV